MKGLFSHSHYARNGLGFSIAKSKHGHVLSACG